MDALSEVLRVVRLTGAAILNADFGAPWALSTSSAMSLSRGFLADGDTPAVFHLVTRGECLLSVDGAEAIRLKAGEVALMAHGDPHWLGDAPESQAVAISSLVRPPIAGEMVPVVHGGSGPRTRIITGLASLDRRLSDPLLGSLPKVVRTDLRGTAAAQHLEGALGLFLSGSDAPRPGGIASLARLAELVFIETIRLHVESIPPGDSGWLAGLGDRYVGRALALMHARPGDDWTVEKLARPVGLSRSALAERFTELLGEPPITYLTHWRLRLAAQQLVNTSRAVESLAREAGYESASAFTHAFKREFGKPPSVWRRKRQRRKG